MPRERASWVPALDWTVLNNRLRRLADIVEGDGRVQVQQVNADATLALTWPRTLVLTDTTAGNVTVTLPPAASVVGYEVVVRKDAGGNTLTYDGAGSETINGSATLAVTTTARLVSTGARWVTA